MLFLRLHIQAQIILVAIQPVHEADDYVFFHIILDTCLAEVVKQRLEVRLRDE